MGTGPVSSGGGNSFFSLGKSLLALLSRFLSRLSFAATGLLLPESSRAALLDRQLPTDGVDPETLLDVLEERVLRYPMGNGHPRFFGWVNSPPAPVGVLADLIAAAMNPSCAGGDHAAIYLERAVVRWLMELIGFPTDGLTEPLAYLDAMTRTAEYVNRLERNPS